MRFFHIPRKAYRIPFPYHLQVSDGRDVFFDRQAVTDAFFSFNAVDIGFAVKRAYFDIPPGFYFLMQSQHSLGSVGNIKQIPRFPGLGSIPNRQTQAPDPESPPLTPSSVFLFHS
jgi:hypothetical protein